MCKYGRNLGRAWAQTVSEPASSWLQISFQTSHSGTFLFFWQSWAYVSNTLQTERLSKQERQSLEPPQRAWTRSTTVRVLGSDDCWVLHWLTIEPGRQRAWNVLHPFICGESVAQMALSCVNLRQMLAPINSFSRLQRSCTEHPNAWFLGLNDLHSIWIHNSKENPTNHRWPLGAKIPKHRFNTAIRQFKRHTTLLAWIENTIHGIGLANDCGIMKQPWYQKWNEHDVFGLWMQLVRHKVTC